MTPLEKYGDVFVKREDLFDPEYPSGKLRAILPYVKELRDEGFQELVVVCGALGRGVAPAAMAAGRFGLALHVFINASENTKNKALEEAASLGNFRTHYIGSRRHCTVRSRARAWTKANKYTAALPLGIPDRGFYKYYSEAVEELPPNPAIHVVPFMSGCWVAGIYLGLLLGKRSSDIIVATPIQNNSGAEKYLSKVLQAVAPDRNRLKNSLPDNVVIDTKRAAATPWPSDSVCTHKAWAVARHWADRQGMPVILWSMFQGTENKHLRG